MASAQHTYGLYIARTFVVRIENVRICTKIMEFDTIQVHMAPFEVILKQNVSYRVWEASGMPPGL